MDSPILGTSIDWAGREPAASRPVLLALQSQMVENWVNELREAAEVEIMLPEAAEEAVAEEAADEAADDATDQ